MTTVLVLSLNKMHMKHVFHNRFRMLIPISGIPEKWDPGPRTSTGETSRCLGGTRELGAQSGTWNFQFCIVFMVYSILNTLHFTCYKTLHESVYKVGEYAEAAITMCYKFRRIISSYFDFSKILGKKTVKDIQLI